MSLIRATPPPPRAPAAVPVAWSPLLGLYGLVFTMVGCVGVAAGFIFATGDWTLAEPSAAVLQRCSQEFPHLTALRIVGYEHCVAGAYRREGLQVLVVAGVVVAATAALTVIVPWVDGWRLGRADRNPPSIAGAAAKFASLCDASGLTGRRRPLLRVPGLGIRQAFTISRPGRRPVIVVPAAVAVAYAADPGQFDAVVLHEMAHVRQGDSSWVSCVRWIAWVTIPAVVLACLPDILLRGGGQVSYTDISQAAVFTAAAVLIAAWLLRRRELDADLQAARWLGSSDALRRCLLGAAGSLAPADKRWWLRPLARHPSAATRVRALQDPTSLQDGGFIHALVAGTVTAMAMNAAYYLAYALNLHEASRVWLLPERVWAAVGGLVLGFSLTPALIRRAIRAHRDGTPAQWWRPVAGAAAGIAVGSLATPNVLPVPGAVTTSVINGSYVSQAIVAVLLTACTAAGIATLAAGLASLAAGRGAGLRPWRTAAAAVAVACSGTAALWGAAVFATIGATDSWAQQQAFYEFALPRDPWRWLALPYLAVALLLMIPASGGQARSRAPSRHGGPAWLRTAAGLALPPLAAAVVAAVLFLPHSYPPAGSAREVFVRVGEERWWICCLAGWAVLIVLLLSGGVRGLARAWISAWVTCLLIGAEFVAYDTVAHHYFGTLAFAVTIPSVWLFYLAVPTSCLSLLGPLQASALRRPWAVTVVTAAGAAVVSVLVFATGIPGLFIPLLASTASSSLPAHSRGAAETGQHGLVLVSGRAREQTDIDAPGIEINGSGLEAAVGSQRMVISATDWNTITSASRVRALVGIRFGPGYDVTAVTHNRFQYLADRISEYGATTFELVPLTAGAEGGQFMVTAALYNPTREMRELSGLALEVVAQPPVTTIASGIVYATRGSALMIPARTIYFARFVFRSYHPVPRSVTRISVNLGYAGFRACRTRACLALQQ